MKSVNVQYGHLSTLIIDDHAAQRQQLRWHMNQLGIETVDQAGTAQEAYAALGRRNYDVVLCDYNLDSNARGVVSNGQQLLEHARGTGVLGPNTIFMMVSGNNSYLDIAATVEHKPDAYLVKPITTKILQDRLQRLLERQAALATITSRQRAKNHEGAIQAADQAMVETPEYTLQALQMKGGSQLELGAYEDAITTFERALAASAKLDWAHHGKARALKGLQRIEEARAVLEDLVSRNPLFASAYELLAAMAEEAGNDQEAVDILQRSLEGLPSPRRTRALAEVAYRAGDVETARTHFDRVLKATKGTFVARTSDVLMLAQSAIDMGDHQDALKLVSDNARLLAQDNTHQSVAYALQAQAYAGSGDMEQALKSAALAKETAGAPSADLNGLLVAKGLLAVGDSSGLAMLQANIKGDHENARMLGLARKILRDTGNEAQIGALIDATAESVRATLAGSQKLRRSGDFAQAKAMVDQALAELPNNTGVLIEASQVYLLLLMRQERKDSAMVSATTGFLQRLDQLLPGDERVVAQHAYFRRVMSAAKR